MSSRVQIHIEGTARVRRKVGRLGPHLAQPYLKDLAEYTRSVAYSLAPKDTRAGAEGIQAHVRDMQAEVITRDRHMVVMELGRRPGSRQPSTTHLAGWGSRHGFVGRKALFALALTIGERGIRGRRFMARAAEAARTKLSTVTKDLAVKVEREWGKD